MTTAIEYPQYSEIMDRSFDTPDEVSEAVYDGIIDCNFENENDKHESWGGPRRGSGRMVVPEDAKKTGVRVMSFLSDEDAAALDAEIERLGLKSRSNAMRIAIREFIKLHKRKGRNERV